MWGDRSSWSLLQYFKIKYANWKKKREQTEVGAGFLQYLKRKFCVRVVGTSCWSRAAVVTRCSYTFVYIEFYVHLRYKILSMCQAPEISKRNSMCLVRCYCYCFSSIFKHYYFKQHITTINRTLFGNQLQLSDLIFSVHA